jgi:hypothetical protein
METKSYTTLDRQELGWPSGEWDTEPDKVQWQDQDTGLPCLAIRHAYFGNWNGYVGVHASHPWYGVEREKIHVHVHGGLSYHGFSDPPEEEAWGICYVPGPGEDPQIWWFGFDCNRGWDLSPLELLREQEMRDWDPWLAVMRSLGIAMDRQYRTLAYVQKQCCLLAVQLAAQIAKQ